MNLRAWPKHWKGRNWSMAIFRCELGCKSPRAWKWVRREKLLPMVTVLYAFLLSLLAEELEALREACLRWGCHRTGKRSRKVAAPLYRLRAGSAASWESIPPRPLHLP